MANPPDERIVIETPPRKRWRLATSGCIVTVLAAGLIIFGSHGNFGLITGLVGLVLFGPLTAAMVIRAVRNRPVLILDGDGFTDRSSLVSGGFVPWQDVQRIEDRQFRRRVFVTVTVTDRDAFRARQPAWRRVLLRINGPMAAGDVLIPDNALPMRPAELVKTMRRLQRAAQRRDHRGGATRRS